MRTPGGRDAVGRAGRVCALVLGLAAPSTVCAQGTGDLAVRRVLLDQAQQAARDGDHARALDLARRAETLEATPSVRLFVAQQFAATSQPVAALGEAVACTREAERDVALSRRDEILRDCRSMVADLQSRVALVTVDVPADLASIAVVRLGERRLDRTLQGVPIPMDPGVVTVVAEAPGHESRTFTLTLSAGRSGTIHVALPVRAVAAVPLATAPAITAPVVSTVLLRVHASVATANIRIDGALAGVGRVERSVTPGTHRIDASAPGHTAFDTEVDAHAGTPVDVEATLPAVRVAPRASNGWVVPVVVTVSVLAAAGIATGVALAVTSNTPGMPSVFRPATGTILPTAYDMVP